MTLTEFLLARIVEDEKCVLAAEDGRPWLVGHTDVCDYSGNPSMDCSCSATLRLAFECEAKRRIVEVIGEATMDHRCNRDIGPFITTDDILGYLALPYADHPDYCDEWKP